MSDSPRRGPARASSVRPRTDFRLQPGKIYDWGPPTRPARPPETSPAPADQSEAVTSGGLTRTPHTTLAVADQALPGAETQPLAPEPMVEAPAFANSGARDWVRPHPATWYSLGLGAALKVLASVRSK